MSRHQGNQGHGNRGARPNLKEVDNALFDAGRMLRGAARRISEAASMSKHQKSPLLAKGLESIAKVIRQIDTDVALTKLHMHRTDEPDAVRNVYTKIDDEEEE